MSETIARPETPETPETSTKTLIAVRIPYGRYDHLSRGRGSVRDARAGASEWGDDDGQGYRVPTRATAHVWHQKTSDGFSRSKDLTWRVPASVVTTVLVGDPQAMAAARRAQLAEQGIAIEHGLILIWQ